MPLVKGWEMQNQNMNADILTKKKFIQVCYWYNFYELDQRYT